MITFNLNEIYDLSTCIYQVSRVPDGLPSRILVVGRTKEFIKYVLVDDHGQALDCSEKKAAIGVNKDGIEYVSIKYVNGYYCRADNFRYYIKPF